MSIEQLSSTTNSLNKLNQHDLSPGQVLKLDQQWSAPLTDERAFLRDFLPPHKEVHDGSIYMPLDIAGKAMLSEIQPGGIIGVVNTQQTLEHFDVETAQRVEGIGLIIEILRQEPGF